MGHVTGLFCLLQLALTKTEAEEGSDDIKPARSSSLCVGVSPRSCQHRGHGQLNTLFLAFISLLRNRHYLRLHLLPADRLWCTMPSEKTFKQRRTFGRSYSFLILTCLALLFRLGSWVFGCAPNCPLNCPKVNHSVGVHRPGGGQLLSPCRVSAYILSGCFYFLLLLINRISLLVGHVLLLTYR